jgi:hypothetical protein
MKSPTVPFSLDFQDALQEMYEQKGVFPGEQIKPARRPWTLLNFLCWATILLSPLFSFVLGVFASGSPLLILTFLGFVGAGNEHRCSQLTLPALVLKLDESLWRSCEAVLGSRGLGQGRRLLPLSAESGDAGHVSCPPLRCPSR